jgi:hypothetical protein
VEIIKFQKMSRSAINQPHTYTPKETKWKELPYTIQLSTLNINGLNSFIKKYRLER